MFNEQRIGEILTQLSSLRYPKSQMLAGFQICKTSEQVRPTPKTVLDG